MEIHILFFLIELHMRVSFPIGPTNYDTIALLVFL